MLWCNRHASVLDIDSGLIHIIWHNARTYVSYVNPKPEIDHDLVNKLIGIGRSIVS